MAAYNTLERKISFKRKKSPLDYFSSGGRDGSEHLPTFFINCVSFLEEHGMIIINLLLIYN